MMTKTGLGERPLVLDGSLLQLLGLGLGDEDIAEVGGQFFSSTLWMVLSS